MRCLESWLLGPYMRGCKLNFEMIRGCYSSSTSVSATEFIFKSATPARWAPFPSSPPQRKPSTALFPVTFFTSPAEAPMPCRLPRACRTYRPLPTPAAPPPGWRRLPHSQRLPFRFLRPASFSQEPFQTLFILQCFPFPVQVSAKLPCFCLRVGVRGKLTPPISPGPGDKFS